MTPCKANPVDSFENLRKRIDRLFSTSLSRSEWSEQLSLDLLSSTSHMGSIAYPTNNISDFIDFFSDSLPDGDVYLFGGVLRDMALFGRRGFSSDIDIVVEGSWQSCVTYLESLGAHRNKFGGYRLKVDGWPVDIWGATETWAIKQGFVSYQGIASLTKTTIMNWDAILMNWRTRNFVCHDRYLESINERLLDLVLEKNPNPLGMAVRVFRHLCMKDARKITPKAANYLASCTDLYSFDDISNSELRSYGNTVIERPLYQLFEAMRKHKHLNVSERFRVASDCMKLQGVALSWSQTEWDFDELDRISSRLPTISRTL